MTTRYKAGSRLAMFVVLAGLSVGGAWAGKPEGVGQGKPAKASKDHAAGNQPGAAVGHGFNAETRRVVNDYYGSRFRSGKKCPPGLAKKNNGCMPPGQAKKWAKGQPIPMDLRVYDLPKDLRLKLPPPPPNHRYVRVAADILLIAIGTQMVIDAMEDIGR